MSPVIDSLKDLILRSLVKFSGAWSRAGVPKLLSVFTVSLVLVSIAPNAWPALVGHWRFDESSGLIAADASGSGRSGTLLAAPGGNSPTWINNGTSGKALHFDGSGEVDIANTASDFNFGESGFSIAAWVRYGTLGASEYMIVMKHYSGYTNGYFLDIGRNWDPVGNANRLDFYFNWDGTRVLTPTRYDDNRWHLVVGTNNGTTGKLYVDGQYIGENTGYPLDNSENLRVGPNFIGDIDDVRVYNHALTQTEISQLYLQGTATTMNSVVPLSYTFDQPTNCGTWCYHDPNLTKLNDGVFGLSDWAANQGSEWDGWYGVSRVNIDFDFGREVVIDRAAIGSTQDSLNNVVLPSFEIYSKVGDNWSLVGERSNPPSSSNNSYLYGTSPHPSFVLNNLGIKSRFVRITAINNGPWIFIDEVQFASLVPASSTNLIDATYGTGAGSFELGNFINNGYGYMGLAPGATTITGWTVGGPGNGVDWLSAPFVSHTGSHSIDLINTSAGSISSVIPTVPGQTYELSFYATTASTGNAFGTVSAGSLVNQSFTAPINTFSRFSFLFTATSGSTTTVTFTSTPTGSSCLPDCFGPVIDSVSVVPATDFFGGTLKTSSNYEFTIEQNIPKTETIQLFNTGSVVRSATLEVVNPHTGLTVAVTEPNPVSIAAGETKSLTLNIDDASLPMGVYDGLLLKIAVDDGSTLYSNIKVNIVANTNLPDLTLGSGDIGYAVSNPGDPVTLTATIRNQGNSPAANVLVRFFEFGTLLGETVVPQVAAKGNTSTSIVVPMDATGDHLVRVVIDPSGTIPELNESNNEASQIVQPGGPSVATDGNMLVSGSLPATVYINSLFTLSGRAVYDLLVNGVRNTDYVVKGGSVQITVTGDGGTEWVYGDVHTDINGNLAKSLQAPATPGTYRIVMTVTDKTFIGKRELVFKVIEPPPPASPPPSPPNPPSTSGAGQWTFSGGSGGTGGSGGSWTWTWTTPPSEPTPQSDLRVFSENIYFSKDHPAVKEEITVFAEIRYWATSTDLLAEDVPVNVYVTYPGTPRLKIGEARIGQMSVGSPDFGSRYVYATWKNRAEGIYLTEVEIDPSYVEENRLNNAATRAIIVGQLTSQLGAISGQITDSWGSGIGNVILQVFEADGTLLGNTATDPAGFYLVQNVPVGNTQVHIETPNGYRADAETKTATVAGSSVSNVDFLLTQQPANQPPVADAGTDRTVRQESLVTLKGSGADPDNGPSPLTFAWSQTIGSKVTLNGAKTARPAFTPSAKGSYTFRLVVYDGADKSAPDKVRITVPMLCDIDLDGDVDRNDTSLITAVRNQMAAPNDLRDYDGDGTVTVNDARSCVLKCTRPVCATQ